MLYVCYVILKYQVLQNVKSKLQFSTNKIVWQKNHYKIATTAKLIVAWSQAWCRPMVHTSKPSSSREDRRTCRTWPHPGSSPAGSPQYGSLRSSSGSESPLHSTLHGRFLPPTQESENTTWREIFLNNNNKDVFMHLNPQEPTPSK